MTPEASERIQRAMSLERHPDHAHATGHLIVDHPLPYSLVASSHAGFLAAAGRAVLKLYADTQQVTWRAPFRPEERPRG